MCSREGFVRRKVGHSSLIRKYRAIKRVAILNQIVEMTDGRLGITTCVMGSLLDYATDHCLTKYTLLFLT